MNDGTYRRLAVAVLVAHQRHDDSSCLCGWGELGRSHPEHVATVLDAAGALRDRPPSAKATNEAERAILGLDPERAQREALRAHRALLRYGQHDETCPALRYPLPDRCECGLDPACYAPFLQEQVPEYVWPMVEALATGEPLDFHELEVPKTIQERLEQS